MQISKQISLLSGYDKKNKAKRIPNSQARQKVCCSTQSKRKMAERNKGCS